MDIQFNCPQCHIPICVPGHSAGKSGKCPNCGATVVVPLIQTNEKQDCSSTPKTTPSPNGLNSASNAKRSQRQADSSASSAYSARRPNVPLNRPKSIEKENDIFAYTETTKRGFWANAEDTWLPGALKISALLVLVGIFYTCGSYYQGVYGPRKNKQQELAKRQEQEKQAVVAMANLSPAPTPVPASTPTPVAVSTQTPVPTQDTVSEFKAIVNRVANSNYVFMNTFRVVKCNYDVVQTDSLVSPVQGIISVLYGYEQGHPDLHQYIICNITFNLKNGQWVAANYSETLMFFGIYNIDKKHQWIQHEGFPKGIVLP